MRNFLTTLAALFVVDVLRQHRERARAIAEMRRAGERLRASLRPPEERGR